MLVSVTCMKITRSRQASSETQDEQSTISTPSCTHQRRRRYIGHLAKLLCDCNIAFPIPLPALQLELPFRRPFASCTIQ
jgi:hypothetical protein